MTEPPESTAEAVTAPRRSERLRELEARQAGAVAGLAAVDGDEDHAPVRELADAGARVALADLVVREVLDGAEDRLAPAHEQRAASERGRHARPGGLQDEPRRDRRPDRRLRLEHGASVVPAAIRTAPSAGIVVPPPLATALTRRVEVGVRARRGERLQHDLGRAGDRAASWRRRRA